MGDRDWDWEGLARACHAEVSRVLGRSPDAEDAVQEALARAWRRRADCRTPWAPTGWVRAIARNEALRIVQRRKVEASLDEEPELAAGAAVARASDVADAVTERLSVRHALEALPPLDRELVALRYEDDMTQPGIAKKLGLPEGTVKVRLHRIRARLVPALTESL
jgi:RNA polymerase sigma-70 factor, ECF subfamily